MKKKFLRVRTLSLNRHQHFIQAAKPGLKRWQGWTCKPHGSEVEKYAIPVDRVSDFLDSGLAAKDFLHLIGFDVIDEVRTEELQAALDPIVKNEQAALDLAVRDNLERRVCEWLALQEDGILEFATPVGRVDVLTESTVYEVKQAHNWKHALGQVVAYGYYFPKRRKSVVLVGKTESFIDAAKFHCNRFDVDLSVFEN